MLFQLINSIILWTPIPESLGNPFTNSQKSQFSNITKFRCKNSNFLPSSQWKSGSNDGWALMGLNLCNCHGYQQDFLFCVLIYSRTIYVKEKLRELLTIVAMIRRDNLSRIAFGFLEKPLFSYVCIDVCTYLFRAIITLFRLYFNFVSMVVFVVLMNVKSWYPKQMFLVNIDCQK